MHVYQIPLNAPAAAVQQLAALLNHEELERSSRFHFERDRARFIQARGHLRRILGQYLDMPADQIAFAYGLNGKPTLRSNKHLTFNLSHSHDLALSAVAWQRELGIDLEWTGRDADYLTIARHFFSLREQAVLQSLPPHALRKAFYACWTRKGHI